MNILNKIAAGSFALAFAVACNDGIDPISYQDPGPDEAAPAVTVNYPFEGAVIQVKEDVTPIVIDLEATDDIEIQSIVINLDGGKIAEFTDFKDYRRALETYTYETLSNGSHILNVVATDLSSKTTSVSVNFSKAVPYQAKYPGEIMYFPFDGDFLELLTITESAPSGGPVFVTGISGKALSLDAAKSAYVTFPGDALAGVSSFSISFFVNPDFVDKDSDGGIDGILGLVNFSNIVGFWGNIDFFVENGSKPAAAKMVVHVTNDDKETWFTEVNNVSGFFNAWSHHTVTYDGTLHQFKYYINGALMSTKAAGWDDALTFKNSGPIVMGTVQFQTNPSLTTGSQSQPWASYLTGELDEVRIFNRALSDVEVQQIYDDVN